MPNRIVREGFLDSEAIHSLSDAGECFYHRLLLAADDAGRFDGRADILRARLFPLDSSRRASDVGKHLAECVSLRLAISYTFASKPFIQLTKWQRCSPCSVSKYPWVDGTFRIEYVKAETRDGLKDFVKTSLSHTDGIPIPSGGDLGALPPMYGDGDGDGDGKSSPPIPSLSQSVFDAWNKLEVFPQCLVLSDKRLKKINTRLEDLFFAANWQQAMERLKSSKFCQGQNERGWRASLDWFLQPDSCAKILEGKYDNTNGAKREVEL